MSARNRDEQGGSHRADTTIPHIPVLERSEQTKGKFPREAFRYEREQDRYVCPAGKILPFRGADRRAGFLRYRRHLKVCSPDNDFSDISGTWATLHASTAPLAR